MSQIKGIYFLVFIVLMSSLAIALEEVAQRRGSFDVDVGDAVVSIGAGNTQNEFCGNNIKEGGEQCDGTDLGGATCSNALGNAIGELSCQPNCVYNTSSCIIQSSNGGSGGGGGGGGSSGGDVQFIGTTNRRESCIESWQCGEWSSCVNGKQIRTCTDTAKCGTEKLKPTTERSCTEKPETTEETSALNRITGAAIGALRNLRNYEVVGIILFILAIVGSALIINSIKREPEDIGDMQKIDEKMEETKAEVKEKPKNSRKTEKVEK